MNNLKTKLLTTAAIVGNTMLIAVPLTAFMYVVFSVISHDFNAVKWTGDCKYFFGCFAFLSLLVGGGVTGGMFERHSS